MDSFRAQIKEIYQIINGFNFDLSSEKLVQTELFNMLSRTIDIKKEHKLSKQSIVDFMTKTGIAIEVKTKGSKSEIFRQCKRYCQYEEVKCFLLITSRSIGMPTDINNKPCYYISISKGML